MGKVLTTIHGVHGGTVRHCVDLVGLFSFFFSLLLPIFKA